MATHDEEAAMTYFGERGLEYWQTGGNCTAFGKNLDDGKHYVLITDADDPSVPVVGKPVRIGLYDEHGLVDGTDEVRATFEEAMLALNAAIEKHVKAA